MRIDSAPVSRQTGAALTGTQPESRMRTGDIVELEVVSSENGVTKLKTQDGGIIKAKLEGGVVLGEGDTARLLVTGKKNGVVYLSTDLEKLTADTGAETAARSAEHTVDARISNRLAQLNIPVREELIGRVRDLLAAHPDMPVDEAVFLASNKVAADSPKLNSMLSLLQDGAKLDKMITSLISLLQNPPEDSAAAQQGAVISAGAGEPEQPGIGDWVKTVLGAAGETAAVSGKETEVAAVKIAPAVEGEIAETKIGEGAQSAENVSIDAQRGPTQTQSAAAGSIIPQAGSELHYKVDEQSIKTSTKLIMDLLSELPEFKGTPPESLERFAGMLTRAASDGEQSAAKWPDDVARITELIDKMFAEPSRGGGGERLKQVRDELFVRLSMLEEEISRTRLPAREAAAAEAQKLIEHVRALQNVEQYVYMQIPVRLGEENKAAELYIFRQKKGGKQFDPDNVNILLSVDLTHLGHWESLVNIRGRDVSLRMEVKSAEAKDFFSENTVKLHSLLDEDGFKLTEASITYSEEETNPLTALSSLLRFKTGNSPRIDLAV